MKNDQREKEEFGLRLRQALTSAGIDGGSPTRLAQEFNRRTAGKSVSVYAARKWMFGESMPTQDKLRTLASWLGVSPVWLRFGESDQVNVNVYAQNEPALSESELDLIRSFRRLNVGHRQAVREMALTLLRIEKQI